jgi:hypothetical protein
MSIGLQLIKNEWGSFMSWTDWVSLGVFIAGFILFLYGANYYQSAVGWAGVYIFIGAVGFFVLKHVYLGLTKKPKVENQ